MCHCLYGPMTIRSDRNPTIYMCMCMSICVCSNQQINITYQQLGIQPSTYQDFIVTYFKDQRLYYLGRK